MTVVHDRVASARKPDTSDAATINDRIAGALGDCEGSYERLVGRRICFALDVDPAFQGPLSPAPNVSANTVTWLRETAAAGASDAAHAAEILALLTRAGDR